MTTLTIFTLNYFMTSLLSIGLPSGSFLKGKQTSKICMSFFALKLLFTMFYITCNFLRFFTFTISEKTELE